MIAVSYSQERQCEDMWLRAGHPGGLVLHPFSILYALSGSAMISTIRVPKL